MRLKISFPIKLIGALAISVGLAVLLLASNVLLVAQASAATKQQAIDLAAHSADFAALLSNHPNWKATAYDSHNSFHVWHVEFHDGDQDLGSADVSVDRHLVYLTRPQVELTDSQRKAGEAAVQKFARGSSAVAAMIGKIPDTDTSIDYNSDANLWVLYFQENGDTVAVVVQFQSPQPFSFTNPYFKGIYFPGVLSFADWQKQTQSEAVNIAFGQAEIAAKLRGHDNWTTEAVYNDDGSWTLSFKADGKTLATATVNVDTQTVISYNANP